MLFLQNPHLWSEDVGIPQCAHGVSTKLLVPDMLLLLHELTGFPAFHEGKWQTKNTVLVQSVQPFFLFDKKSVRT